MFRFGRGWFRLARGSKQAVSRPVLIDKYIEEAWKKAGVKPAQAGVGRGVSPSGISRLAGTNPHVQEARAFLSTRENDKRAKLITYLLDHPDYAKNFATLWTRASDRSRQSGTNGRSPGADGLAAQAVRR